MFLFFSILNPIYCFVFECKLQDACTILIVKPKTIIQYVLIKKRVIDEEQVSAKLSFVFDNKFQTRLISAYIYT